MIFLIFLCIIILLCLCYKKENFKSKRPKVKFSVPELTDDDTADLIGGLQSIGAQACENAKYDNINGTFKKKSTGLFSFLKK